ncbi:28S ribosomal protein S33, mitochondrial [Plecturocebus cupreus]
MSSLSEYALRMSRLSARLFGEVARPTDSKSMKVVKLFSELPLAKKKETYDWYPDHHTYSGLIGPHFWDSTEMSIRILWMTKRLKNLSEGKPKKGEGKRAAKRNSAGPQEGEFLPQ